MPRIFSLIRVSAPTGDDHDGRADSTIYVSLQAPMAEAALYKVYPWNHKITEYSELEGTHKDH